MFLLWAALLFELKDERKSHVLQRLYAAAHNIDTSFATGEENPPTTGFEFLAQVPVTPSKLRFRLAGKLAHHRMLAVAYQAMAVEVDGVPDGSATDLAAAQLRPVIGSLIAQFLDLTLVVLEPAPEPISEPSLSRNTLPTCRFQLCFLRTKHGCGCCLQATGQACTRRWWRWRP